VYQDLQGKLQRLALADMKHITTRSQTIAHVLENVRVTPSSIKVMRNTGDNPELIVGLKQPNGVRINFATSAEPLDTQEAISLDQKNKVS